MNYIEFPLLPQEELFGVQQAGQEIFQTGAAIGSFGNEIGDGFQLRFARWPAEGGEVQLRNDLPVGFAGGEQAAQAVIRRRQQSVEQLPGEQLEGTAQGSV